MRAKFDTYVAMLKSELEQRLEVRVFCNPCKIMSNGYKYILDLSFVIEVRGSKTGGILSGYVRGECNPEKWESSSYILLLEREVVRS